MSQPREAVNGNSFFNSFLLCLIATTLQNQVSSSTLSPYTLPTLRERRFSLVLLLLALRAREGVGESQRQHSASCNCHIFEKVALLVAVIALKEVENTE